MRTRKIEVELKVQESHSILMGHFLGDADLPDGTKITAVAIGHNMQITVDGDMQVMADLRPIIGGVYELYKGDDMDYEKDLERRIAHAVEAISNVLRANSNLHVVEELVHDAIQNVEGKSYYVDIHE